MLQINKIVDLAISSMYILNQSLDVWIGYNL